MLYMFAKVLVKHAGPYAGHHAMQQHENRLQSNFAHKHLILQMGHAGLARKRKRPNLSNGRLNIYEIKQLKRNLHAVDTDSPTLQAKTKNCRKSENLLGLAKYQRKPSEFLNRYRDAIV